MDYSFTIVLGLIAVVVVLWLVVLSFGGKKKWYKIERADGERFVLYRRKKEMWRTDILRFKDEASHEYTFHWHWVMSLEEIDESEVEVIRDEIKRTKEAMLEREDSE